MEKEKINKDIANQHVLDILKRYIDLGEKSFITTNIINHEVTYELHDTKMVKNNFKKRIIPLKTKEYFALLKHAYSRMGYSKCYIRPIIRDEVIQYEISFSITQESFRRGR